MKNYTLLYLLPFYTVVVVVPVVVVVAVAVTVVVLLLLPGISCKITTTNRTATINVT